MGKGCCTWDRAFIIMGIVVAVLTVITVAIGSVLASEKDSIHRVVVDLKASNVFPAGAGEGTQQATCKVTIDENANSISFRCRIPPTLSGVMALHIRGPIQRGNATWSGEIAGVLCGSVVGPGNGCDTITTPGEFSGTVAYEISDNQSTTGRDVRPLNHAIREDPDLFYLELLTSLKPTSPGAMRGSMAQFTGWP